MKHPKFSRSFEVVSELPEPLKPLKTLAQNYYWTWRHELRDQFRTIDRDLWNEVNHNPVEFLARLSEDRIRRLCSDDNFLLRLAACEKELADYLSSPTWFDATYPGAREKTTIAYFCAEFGISESLPIYSGGLGILAGDHLKAASDLGLPLVAVGLLYNRGYFKQRLTHDGWQEERYPQYDFFKMPLQLVRGKDEEPIRVEIELPDRTISCQIWKAMVGRIPLFLLDSNVFENAPSDQGITDTLYGGDEEMRIRQEMILGIGGLRALHAMGIPPTVCHMNEGHAAFLSVERIRHFMQERGCDFKTARQVIVAGNVFTTHTPVPAGFDVFTPAMIERYMGKSVQAVGVDFKAFLKLGRIDADNEGEAFNMAVLAMETANHVNGVAKLHASVTREMFQARWPDYPQDEVPVEAITNGIHTSTWISRGMAAIFDRHLGGAWRRAPSDPENWACIDEIPDDELWRVREDLRGDFVRFVRSRLQREMERRSMGRADFSTIGQILDPRILTIGFARRFATYKRGSLILQDRERLLKILHHPERPVQIVLAGKSHPRDEAGKKIIQEIYRFIEEGGAKGRMVFLEDYDMEVARNMVSGVDVWLNNPRRPMEASGTSGMKVVPNGGLNCSVLDGWWDEGYAPEYGWAIGERETYWDQGYQDWLDSRAIYALLETNISPKFYHRMEHGVPKEWVQMIKNSIRTMAPTFSTGRMVREYATRFYMPAAEAYQRLSADGLARARDAREWREKIRREWSSVKVGKVEDTAKVVNAVGAKVTISAMVHLGGLKESDVEVQAVIGKIGPNRDLLQTHMKTLKHKKHTADGDLFEGETLLPETGHQGYTIRVLPSHPDVHVASELGLVSWQAE